MRKGDWNGLRAVLTRPDYERGRLLVGLDFDGTLAEIAQTPHQAKLSAGTRRRLRALLGRPDTALAVLSGRALGDVRKLVALPGIYYAGNHGLEISGPDLRWVHPRASALDRPSLRAIERGLGEFPGAYLEHKGLGAAVHYRRVRARDVQRLRNRIQAGIFGLGLGIRTLNGKMTFDIRPNIPWNKGHALEMIRRRLPGQWVALLAGDDATDEEAFRTIGSKALTIRVGPARRSSARYILGGRGQVDELLEILGARAGCRPAEVGRPE